MDFVTLDQHTMALLEQLVYNQEKNQLSRKEQVALSIMQGMFAGSRPVRVSQVFDLAEEFLKESEKRK